MFDRGGERLKYEICREKEGGFMLVVTQPDGKQRVERIAQPTEVIEKSVDQMRRLHDQGWKIG